jgi:ABC-type glycerol-3-phosphate transport system substrate-binding protein
MTAATGRHAPRGRGMQRIAIAMLLIAVLTAACSRTAPTHGPTNAPTKSPSNVPSNAPTEVGAGSCSIPPRTYDDLAACTGASEEIELQVAENSDGKTVGRIAVASKDPLDILAAMGAYASANISTNANSFTVFAYGSADDYENGTSYNRGRIFRTYRGPIKVAICTEFAVLDDGRDFCTKEQTYTVAM